MYHRIADESFDPWGLAVSAARFRDQLDWLSTHGPLLPLGEFAARHRAGTLPSRAIALTFDDGYDCTARLAAPTLETMGIPATIFISPVLIERGRPYWWDELKGMVLETDRESLSFDGEQVPLGRRDAADSRWLPGARPRTSRQEAFHRIWAALRPRPTAEIDAAVSYLREQSKVAARAPRPMSPAQVRASASELIEFGAHALTHPWLSSLASSDKAREIGQSAAQCEILSGRRATTFAYPYGNFDAESEQLVAQAGFACACATDPRPVTKRSRIFALPRIGVGDWTGAELARVLAS